MTKTRNFPILSGLFAYLATHHDHLDSEIAHAILIRIRHKLSHLQEVARIYGTLLAEQVTEKIARKTMTLQLTSAPFFAASQQSRLLFWSNKSPASKSSDSSPCGLLNQKNSEDTHYRDIKLIFFVICELIYLEHNWDTIFVQLVLFNQAS